MPKFTGYVPMQIVEQVLAAFKTGYNTAYTTKAPPTGATAVDCIESQTTFSPLEDYLTVEELSGLVPEISDVALTLQYWNGTAWTDGIDSTDTVLRNGFVANWNTARETVDVAVPHTLTSAISDKYRVKVAVTQP